MDNLPRQKLCELIAKYGESLCDEPLRLEGLLRDLCGKYRLEINLFVQALKEGIATDLRSASVSGHTDLLLARLGKRLQDHYAVSEESARWVVESWALALGKIGATDLTKQREASVSKPAVALPREAMEQSHRAGEQMVAARSFHQLVHETSAAPITYVPPKRGKGWLVILSIVVLLCLGGAVAWYFKLLPLPKAAPTAAAVASAAPKETPPTPVASAVPTITTTVDRAPVETESSTLLRIGAGYKIETNSLVVERYGFVNTRGRVIIEPQWEDTLGFFEGLACVKRNGKWGFIDKTGRVVIDPQWEDDTTFNEGLALVKRAGKYGFIDKTGHIVIEPNWEAAVDFSEGLAAVKRDGKWGFIDKTGRVVIKPQWEEFAYHVFREGLACVNRGGVLRDGMVRGGKWGFIDKTGRVASEPQWEDYPGNFSEGLAAVKRGEKWGFIDKTGRVVIKPQWEEAGNFHEGLACVERGGKRDPILTDTKVGGKLGFIDKTGRVVIEPRWDYRNAGISPSGWTVSEGLAAVELGEKWGVIDKTGRVVIQPQWKSVGDFHQGRALVQRGENWREKWGLIDKTGRVVIEPQWDVLDPLAYQESNAPLYYMFARQEGNKVVVVWFDSKGEQIWSSDNQSR